MIHQAIEIIDCCQMFGILKSRRKNFHMNSTEAIRTVELTQQQVLFFDLFPFLKE